VSGTIAVLSLLAAIGSAVAAFGAWRSASQSNATATQLARIEQARRHQELTPQFAIACRPIQSAPGFADLTVELVGGIGHLDEVTITILDESGQDHRGRGLPDGVSQEEFDACVWGPWDFNVGASEQVLSNRQTRRHPYTLATGRNEPWNLLREVQPAEIEEGNSWRAAAVPPN
jgi:hypothetical protein